MPAGPISRLEFACGLLAAVTGWAGLAIVLLLVSVSQNVSSGALVWGVVTAALFAELGLSAVGHSRGGSMGWLASLLLTWILLVSLTFGGVLISFAVFLSPALLLGLVANIAAATRLASNKVPA